MTSHSIGNERLSRLSSTQPIRPQSYVLMRDQRQTGSSLERQISPVHQADPKSRSRKRRLNLFSISKKTLQKFFRKTNCPIAVHDYTPISFTSSFTLLAAQLRRYCDNAFVASSSESNVIASSADMYPTPDGVNQCSRN